MYYSDVVNLKKISLDNPSPLQTYPFPCDQFIITWVLHHDFVIAEILDIFTYFDAYLCP